MTHDRAAVLPRHARRQAAAPTSISGRRDSTRGRPELRTDSDWLRGFEFESTTYAHDARRRSARPGGGGPDDQLPVRRTGRQPAAARSRPTSSGLAPSATLHRARVRWLARDEVDDQVREPGRTRSARPRSTTSATSRPPPTTGAPRRPTRRTGTSGCSTRSPARRSSRSSCAAPRRFPDHAVADLVFGYDDDGNVTRTEVAKERPAAGPVYVRGQHRGLRRARPGHRVDRRDWAARPRRRTPRRRAARPPGVTTTSPATTTLPQGLVTTTTLEPAFGVPTKVVDPNAAGHRGRLRRAGPDHRGVAAQPAEGGQPAGQHAVRLPDPAGRAVRGDHPARSAPTACTPPATPSTTVGCGRGRCRPRRWVCMRSQVARRCPSTRAG